MHHGSQTKSEKQSCKELPTFPLDIYFSHNLSTPRALNNLPSCPLLNKSPPAQKQKHLLTLILVIDYGETFFPLQCILFGFDSYSIREVLDFIYHLKSQVVIMTYIYEFPEGLSQDTALCKRLLSHGFSNKYGISFLWTQQNRRQKCCIYVREI